MTFLVTGGTGFIGKRVVSLLLEKNINVVATDINTNSEQEQFDKYLNQKKINKNNLKLIDLDISSKNEIKSIITDNKITNIIACGYQMSNLLIETPLEVVKLISLG
tara:strand:- start:155 stop:472 length:318 start_codon:yes stop_codon:yes gene_type:complete